MKISNSVEEIPNAKPKNKINNCSKKNDVILCDYCKRTHSNGIRCLGMCVADNDY